MKARNACLPLERRVLLAAFVSDDFHSSTLDTSRWTLVNPVGDCGVSLNGNAAVFAIPGGVDHDLWTAGNRAPRIMQSISDEDFELEVKFDSQPIGQYSIQGLIVQASPGNYLRFDAFSHDSTKHVFAASYANNAPTVRFNSGIGGTAPQYMRVKRVDNTWTQRYSFDGVSWTTAAQFDYSLAVTQAGVAVGNAGGSPPAYTGVVDYVFNTASPIIPEDGGGGGGPAAIISDDFHSPILNTDIWTFVDPVGDSTLSLSGTNAVISVPAGSDHDVWTAGNRAPRLMQPAADTDFQIEVKFDSQPAGQYALQGLIVQASPGNYLRFDTYSNGSTKSVFAASFTGDSPTVRYNTSLGTTAPRYMRVKRQGDLWTQFYSTDGIAWTTAAQFTQPLAVTQVGVFVGNAGPSPAYSGSIDYFFNTAAPIVPEDGGQQPVTNPVVDVWYGSTQSFGQIGNPQRWVNVLGRATDADGIASLTWSLNGGAASPLEVGPNATRLENLGDFNVEIDRAQLAPGNNSVVIAATDSMGNVTSRTVTVNYTTGKTWPTTYAADWSKTSNINSIAQVVDGLWKIENGAIRTAEPGYDRIVAIGDVAWRDYEVTVPVTIHSYMASKPEHGVGIITRWAGHYDGWTGQPRVKWWPLGGLGWYQGGTQLSIVGNNLYDIARNPSFPALSTGQQYTFKMRVQSHASDTSTYSLKVWRTGAAEPATWSITGTGPTGELAAGSVLLLAYNTDVSFGKALITPIPTVVRPPSTIVSDDFRGNNLNTAVWTFVNPVGDGSMAMNGINALLTVPGGTNHDLWDQGNRSVRLMQAANDTDFEIEVKFASSPSGTYAMQGVTVEASPGTYVRFDTYSVGTAKYVFGAVMTNNAPDVHVNASVGSTAPQYLRVKRQGDLWTLSYSTDGAAWTAAGSFSYSMVVTKVGVHAGNAGTAPAFTASVDHFFNTAARITPED